MNGEAYTKQLTRALYNWHLSGGPEAFAPVMAALREAYRNDTDVLVPYLYGEDPDAPEGDSGRIYVPEKHTEILLSRVPAGESGSLIPLFTSREEAEKGETEELTELDFGTCLRSLASWPECAGFILDPFGKPLVITRECLPSIEEGDVRSTMSLIRGSVLEVRADAVVNAANESLLGGGGVDGAIHRAAGPELLRACRKIGGCPTGETRVTRAYGIRSSDIIIHAVGPVYDGTERCRDDLARCYYRSLNEVMEHGLRSVAFPCISAGVFGYPLREAASVAVGAVLAWFQEHEDFPIDVYFCCFRAEEAKVYEEIFERLQKM